MASGARAAWQLPTGIDSGRAQAGTKSCIGLQGRAHRPANTRIARSPAAITGRAPCTPARRRPWPFSSRREGRSRVGTAPRFHATPWRSGNGGYCAREFPDSQVRTSATRRVRHRNAWKAVADDLPLTAVTGRGGLPLKAVGQLRRPAKTVRSPPAAISVKPCSAGTAARTVSIEHGHRRSRRNILAPDQFGRAGLALSCCFFGWVCDRVSAASLTC